MENQSINQQFDEEAVREDIGRIIPLEKQQKLEELKRIALEKGLTKAVFIAKKMDDPFLLDELHDALTDELKAHLISEGKLESL
jgi:hypothetical protein